MLVLVFYLCPSSVRVVATFSGTILFPLIFSVLLFFPLIHWFFSLSNFVIPSKCLKNFICAASKRCFSLFFSTQASLPNFSAALEVKLGYWRKERTLNVLIWLGRGTSARLFWPRQWSFVFYKLQGIPSLADEIFTFAELFVLYRQRGLEMIWFVI